MLQSSPLMKNFHQKENQAPRTVAFTDCISNATAVDNTKLITNPSDLPKEVNKRFNIFLNEINPIKYSRFKIG